MSIKVQGITRRFGPFVALSDINLEVPSGELVALLGPSGSGKTTLLRIIAGLDHPDEGSVLFEDEELTGKSARERNFGFVFQHYALFRHMTVFENVAFGLRVRRRPEEQIKKRVGELLHLVRLEGLAGRYPAQLSGGQRQRIALARALAAEPRVLLLDEPFGALDAKVRLELRQWLRRWHDEVHVTSLFVTHDQEEAFEVADKVVIMKEGRIEQTGSPDFVFDNPANEFVMDFLGNVNVFHGRVHQGRARVGHLEFDCPDYPHDQARHTKLYIRPHELEIEKESNGGPSMKARVLHLNPAGSVMRVQLHAPELDTVVNADLTHERREELGLKPGDEVYLSPRRVRTFEPAPEDYVI